MPHVIGIGVIEIGFTDPDAPSVSYSSVLWKRRLRGL
jgi:hypothetical protein